MEMLKTLLTIMAIILGLDMAVSQQTPLGKAVSTFGIEKNYLFKALTQTHLIRLRRMSRLQ